MMYRCQPLLFQPVPSRLGYPVSVLLDEVRAAYFPQIERPIEARFAAFGPLATIRYDFMGDDDHVVFFHPVLNHPGTPVEVMRFVAKHELTHLVCPPRVIDGEVDSHPPEFWEHEFAVGPERYAAWAWINANFSRCARRGGGRYTVTGRWRALRDSPRTPYTPSLPFNGERWDRVCPGDGGQLLLPPAWVALPL